ncbi:hypothetical protein BWZ20_01030 [Winogradskyella sp. J14-2]|nr:hypothetical protein BWZ20_01030 [Winogradskyella sp. J14-2]
MLPCMSKTHFGLDCIGCGFQRSAVLLIKGDFVASFFMYPALYPMLLFFAFLIFDTFKKIKHSEKLKLTLACLTLIAAVGNYTLKLFLTN